MSPREHLTVCGDIVGFHNWDLLLGSGEKSLEVLLNI